MKFGARTDIGKWREQNEDAFACAEELGLFLVADGMGGHSGGEVASALAVQVIRDHIATLKIEPTVPDLKAAVQEANRRIFDHASEEASLFGMGTTVVLAHFGSRGTTILHVGDSRAYRMMGKKLECLTEDHTLVKQLVREGKMTEYAARQHPNRSALLRAVGVDRTVEIDALEVSELGDLFILCTDGLTEMISEEKIAEILQSVDDPQSACDLLVEHAVNEGGRDNVTVVAIRPK